MQLDSYDDGGLLTALAIVNALAIGHAFGRPAPTGDRLEAMAQVLSTDPTSAAMLRGEDVPGFVVLAEQLRGVFDELDRDDVDAAAARLNDMLAAHPAHPHLAKEDGRWRVHHHSSDAALVPMTTSICAEGLARFIGAGHAARVGVCNAASCDRVYVDLSKNGSRLFCSTACQNRVKAAAFRQRQSTSSASP
ncbi:MAG: CGNR zinc finger domain-containing protein [Acidimicrobiales bacterium]